MGLRDEVAALKKHSVSEEEYMGRKINEAVARKLGWTCELVPALKDYVNWRNPSGTGGICLPDYCHSIEAAWEVVEHLKNFWVGIRYKPSVKQFNAVIATDEKALSEEIDTAAPMAICKAFLRMCE